MNNPSASGTARPSTVVLDRRPTGRPLAPSGAMARPLRSRANRQAEYWSLRLTLLCSCIWIVTPIIGFITAVKLLTTVGLVAALVGIRRPILGVYGITILCTLDSVTRVFVMTGGLYRWNTVNYLLLIMLAFGFRALIKRNDLSTRSLQLLLAYLLLQLFGSPDFSAGIQHLFGAVAYFGLLLFLYRGTREESVWKGVCLLSNVLAAFGGFWFFLYVDDLPYINSNSWVYLPLAALFSACLWRSTAPRNLGMRPLIWSLVIINCVWVILAGSRGGMTIAICCVAYLLWEMPRVSSRIMVLVGGALVGIAVANQFVERQAYVIHRFDKTVDTERSLSSRTSGRSDLVIGAWRIFKEHPILGVGTGAFAINWKNLEDRHGMGSYAEDRKRDAHSSWLKTLAEGGIIGFLLQMMFVFSFTVVGLRAANPTVRRLGFLVSMTLSIAFLSTEFQGKGFWFLAAGGAVVLERESIARRQRPRLTPGAVRTT